MLVVNLCVMHMGIILWTPSWRPICWRYWMDIAWCTVGSESRSWRERESFEFSEWVFCTVSQNFRPREVQTGHLKASSLCQDHRTVETYADFVDHGSSCSHEDRPHVSGHALSPVVHYTAKRMKVWTTLPELREDFESTSLKHKEILRRTLWMLQGKLSTQILLWKILRSYNQLQNVETLPRKKRPFLLQIAPGHRSVRYNTDLPPPSHSKLFLQVLSMVLYC